MDRKNSLSIWTLIVSALTRPKAKLGASMLPNLVSECQYISKTEVHQSFFVTSKRSFEFKQTDLPNAILLLSSLNNKLYFSLPSDHLRIFLFSSFVQFLLVHTLICHYKVFYAILLTFKLHSNAKSFYQKHTIAQLTCAFISIAVDIEYLPTCLCVHVCRCNLPLDLHQTCSFLFFLTWTASLLMSFSRATNSQEVNN